MRTYGPGVVTEENIFANSISGVFVYPRSEGFYVFASVRPWERKVERMLEEGEFQFDSSEPGWINSTAMSRDKALAIANEISFVQREEIKKQSEPGRSS